MKCLLRPVAVFSAFLLAASAQEPRPKLNLVIIEGEGAINNLNVRTAREPMVQVEDENHKPIAGAIVVFSLPTHGAGGAFAGGAHELVTQTDSAGRAVARGLQANKVKGQYQIHVNASFQGQTASLSIAQTNAVAAGSVAVAAGGISTKLIVIIAVAGAAAAGGVVAATRMGGGATPTATIGVGTTAVSVSPPH